MKALRREAREKAEQRLQAVEEDLHFASDLCPSDNDNAE